MNIALWNVDHAKRFSRIQNEVSTLDADIVILTEADTRITHPLLPLRHSSLTGLDESEDAGLCSTYRKSEARTMIFSRFEKVREHIVSDPYTNCCVDLITPEGVEIRVLATIVGVQGYKEFWWQRDFNSLLTDLSPTGKNLAAPNLILAGDVNVNMHQMPENQITHKRHKLVELMRQFSLYMPTLGYKMANHLLLGTHFTGGVTSLPMHEKISDHHLVMVKGIMPISERAAM